MMPKLREAIEETSSVETQLRIVDEKLYKLEKLNEAECPTCFRPIDKDGIEEIKGELEEEEKTFKKLNIEKINNANKISDEMELIAKGEFREAIALSESIKANEEKLISFEADLKKAKLIYKEKLQQQQEFISSHEKLSMLEERMPEYEAELSSVHIELATIKLEKKSFDRVDKSLLKSELNKLKSQKEEGIRAQNSLEITIEKGKKDRKRKDEITNSIKSKLHILELLEKLCTAFSHRGIPAIIIERLLPEIEITANDFLSKISDNLQVEFQTVEKLKNGNEQDTLKIIIHDGKQFRAFETYSGGEKFRVSLAIRLALSKILTRRAGVDLELLILDEPGAFLDDNGRNSFVQMINGLKDSFSNILVITHLTELKAAFDNRLNIGD